MLKMICPECAKKLGITDKWKESDLRSAGDMCQQCGCQSYLSEVNVEEIKQ